MKLIMDWLVLAFGVSSAGVAVSLLRTQDDATRRKVAKALLAFAVFIIVLTVMELSL